MLCKFVTLVPSKLRKTIPKNEDYPAVSGSQFCTSENTLSFINEHLTRNPPILLAVPLKMVKYNWRNVAARFMNFHDDVSVAESVQDVAPPTKKMKISSWRAIDHPEEGLLELPLGRSLRQLQEVLLKNLKLRC